MRSDIMFSNEAFKIFGWTTVASRQAQGSCPVIAYKFEFLFSEAQVSLQLSAVAYYIPRGRPDVDLEVTSLLCQMKGWKGEVSSAISHQHTLCPCAD